MNYQEYKEKLKVIKEQQRLWNQKETDLIYSFVQENKPFNKGNIIEKDNIRIKIAEISLRSFWVGDVELIQWVFRGIRYNKKNEPDSRATSYHQITYIEDFETVKLIKENKND